MLHIRWITDIHNPAEKMLGLAYKNAVLGGLEAFVKDTRNRYPSLVINTGDNVSTTPDAKTDERLHAEVHAITAPIAGILKTITGNHDVRHQGAIDLAAKFNFLSGSEVLDFNEATILLWKTPVTPSVRVVDGSLWGTRRSYAVSDADLDWLKQALANAPQDKPVLLFSHFPHDGNAYVDPKSANEVDNPDTAHYTNLGQIQHVLQASGRRIFTFGGHRHITRMQGAGNITYLTQDRFYRDSARDSRWSLGIHVTDIIVTKGQVDLARSGHQSLSFRL